MGNTHCMAGEEEVHGMVTLIWWVGTKKGRASYTHIQRFQHCTYLMSSQRRWCPDQTPCMSCQVHNQQKKRDVMERGRGDQRGWGDGRGKRRSEDEEMGGVRVIMERHQTGEVTLKWQVWMTQNPTFNTIHTSSIHNLYMPASAPPCTHRRDGRLAGKVLIGRCGVRG